MIFLIAESSQINAYQNDSRATNFLDFSQRHHSRLIVMIQALGLGKRLRRKTKIDARTKFDMSIENMPVVSRLNFVRVFYFSSGLNSMVMNNSAFEIYWQ